MTITGSVIGLINAKNWKGRKMNKQLENKIGHQAREILALQDKVERLGKRCLELERENEILRNKNQDMTEDRR